LWGIVWLGDSFFWGSRFTGRGGRRVGGIKNRWVGRDACLVVRVFPPTFLLCVLLPAVVGSEPIFCFATEPGLHGTVGWSAAIGPPGKREHNKMGVISKFVRRIMGWEATCLTPLRAGPGLHLLGEGKFSSFPPLDFGRKGATFSTCVSAPGPPWRITIRGFLGRFVLLSLGTFAFQVWGGGGCAKKLRGFRFFGSIPEKEQKTQGPPKGPQRYHMGGRGQGHGPPRNGRG